MAGTEPVALVHCGWTSVYTVDAASGDLQETYLPALGQPWHTQDLSVNYRHAADERDADRGVPHRRGG